MSETFDLRVDSIAAGGDGVGRHDGIVVFVPRAAPGDLVRVEAVREGRLMRGRILDVLAASPARVAPRCQHYVGDSCGGCQLQHLDYSAQLAAKAGIIRDALTRIGHVAAVTPVVEPSDAQWRYRSKLTLSLRRLGDGVVAGMHRVDDPESVFALRDCDITDERVMQAWRMVLARPHLLPREERLRVAVRLLSTGFSLTVEGGTRWDHSREIVAEIPELVELWWKPRDKHRRLMLGTSRAKEAGASFTQVNASVARRLIEYVAGLAAGAPHSTAVDAYSGTGDTAVALAALGARVTAIEIDRDACALCLSRLPHGSRAIAASVEHALSEALPAELVVLNPPRAGLAPVVIEALQAPRAPHPAPRTLIYVSCNPATLARDLKRLDRYTLTSVRGFDMFPQTAHVETVCALELAA